MLIRDETTCGERKKALDAYMVASVLASDFICPNFNHCRSSHPDVFLEGQLHHVGNSYELFLEGVPLRVAIVGQEYGHHPARVDSLTRHAMIMSSAFDRRFKARDGLPARNPHMRGTTNVLRLLFGLPLGDDFESEFLALGKERVHIFDAFALVNYLLCSAVGNDGSTRGQATRTMLEGCQHHFREAMQILEPTVVILQGKGFWKWIVGAFDSVIQYGDHTYRVKLGSNEALVAAFTHPSAHHPNNWGANSKTPYLLNTVVPTITDIRDALRAKRLSSR